MTLGELLKSKRNAAQLTLEELSERAGSQGLSNRTTVGCKGEDCLEGYIQ